MIVLVYLQDSKLHTITSMKELLGENIAFLLDRFDEFPDSVHSFITSIIEGENRGVDELVHDVLNDKQKCLHLFH